jgi:small basic protein
MADRSARFVSFLFNPLVAATSFFLAVLAREGLGWFGLVLPLWSLLVAAPALMLVTGLKLGVFSDLDVSELRERRRFMPLATLSALAAALLALAAHLPFLLRLSTLSIAIWLLIATLVGSFWKLSLHLGAASGLLLLVGVSFGWQPALFGVWLPPLLAWARLRLGAHDLWQVVGGTLAGLLAVAVAFAALSPGFA